MRAYLKLNLRLGNILLASVSAGNLLSLSDLVPHSIGAEVLKGVTLNSVNAESRVGLDGSEATGHYKYPSQFIHPPILRQNILLNQVLRISQGLRRTEELLGGTGLLNDLNEAGLELLDRRNVVGQDTHLTGLGGQVHLHTVPNNQYFSHILTHTLQYLAVVVLRAGTSGRRRGMDGYVHVV